ncbi:MAG: hypothetical protein EBR82_10775 [Caulobacteraceae bacterium]|nr:hypothetical protein [Caulobacteraceae bacterium]
MGFSATDAAFEGFKVVRRHPMTIVFWSLLYIVTMVVGFALAGPAVLRLVAQSEAMEAASSAGGQPSLADMQMIVQTWTAVLALAGPVSLIMGAVLSAAVARAVVRPSESAFGYLRLGMDELRVLVVSLVLGIAVYAVWIFGVIVTVALGVLAYTSGQPALWIAVVLAGIAAVVATVWLTLRLCLAVPIVVHERRWAFADSFALTKGRVLPLLGMAIIAGVMFILVNLLGTIIAMPVQLITAAGFNPAAFEGQSVVAILQAAWPAILGWIVIQSILAALQIAVLYAPFSAAYRDIKGLPHE